MTTSRTPWTTEHNGDGAYIKDASGNVIGCFNDWRDAEICVGAVRGLHHFRRHNDRAKDEALADTAKV